MTSVMLEYRLPPLEAAFYQLIEDSNRQREITEWCKEMSEKKIPKSVKKQLERLGFLKNGIFRVDFNGKHDKQQRREAERKGRKALKKLLRDLDKTKLLLKPGKKLKSDTLKPKRKTKQ